MSPTRTDPNRIPVTGRIVHVVEKRYVLDAAKFAAVVARFRQPALVAGICAAANACMTFRQIAGWIIGVATRANHDHAAPLVHRLLAAVVGGACGETGADELMHEPLTK